MATKTDICNQALAHIGQDPIAIITENTETAKKCARAYPLVLDEVLAAHPWNFALDTEALAVISDKTIHGWQYVYQKPARCLFAYKVFPAGYPEARERDKFRVMGAAIASNVEGAWVEGVYRCLDISLYTPHFIAALSFALASRLALSICGDKSLSTSMFQLYLMHFGESKRLNVAEGYNPPEAGSSFVDAR